MLCCCFFPYSKCVPALSFQLQIPYDPKIRKDPKVDIDCAITVLKMALKLTDFIIVIHCSIIISKIIKYLLSKTSPRSKQDHYCWMREQELRVDKIMTGLKTIVTENPRKKGMD